MNTISPNAIALRPLETYDAAQLFELVEHNRPQLKKFWWEQQTQSPIDSLRFIQSVNDIEIDNGAPTRAITKYGSLVGIAALHTIDVETQSSLLGYWLDNRESGQGIASEAVRQLITQEAFGNLALHEVRIDTRESNTASRAIAEKLGFQLQKISNEPLWLTEEALVSTALYSLTKESFYATVDI